MSPSWKRCSRGSLADVRHSLHVFWGNVFLGAQFRSTGAWDYKQRRGPVRSNGDLEIYWELFGVDYDVNMTRKQSGTLMDTD